MSRYQAKAAEVGVGVSTLRRWVSAFRREGPLGISEHVLMRHRQHVEQAAGLRVFEPRNPLAPTREGARFLRQAGEALRRLDLSVREG
jgi:hypothetical protein